MSENAPSQTLAGRYVGPTAATPYRSGKIPHGRTAADRIGADAHVRRRPLDGARSGTDAIRPGIPERATGRRDIRRSPRSVRCPRGAAVASRRYPRVGRSTENSGSGHCRTRRRTPHAAQDARRRQREKPAQSETLEVAIASQRKLHQQRRAPKRDAAACSGLVRLPPGCPYLRGRLTVHKVHRGFELAHQNARLLPEHFVGHFGQGVLFGLQKSMAHPVRCARRIGLLFQRGAQRRVAGGDALCHGGSSADDEGRLAGF